MPIFDVEKLAETEYPIFDGDLLGIAHNQEHRRFGFIAGYNKAKETLYTDLINWIDNEILLNPYYKDSSRLKEGVSMVKIHIQSLKQPKKD